MDEKLLKEYIAEAFKESVTYLIDEIHEWIYDRLYDYVDYDDIKNSFEFIDDEIQIHVNTLQHFLSKEEKKGSTENDHRKNHLLHRN